MITIDVMGEDEDITSNEREEADAEAERQHNLRIAHEEFLRHRETRLQITPVV
jgi:hypothetical protein